MTGDVFILPQVLETTGVSGSVMTQAIVSSTKIFLRFLTRVVMKLPVIA